MRGTDRRAVGGRLGAALDAFLLGLVRHLTEMERHYLVYALSGQHHGFNYCTEDDGEADIERLDISMVGESMSRWRQERDTADILIAQCADLSEPVATGWARRAGTCSR